MSGKEKSAIDRAIEAVDRAMKISEELAEMVDETTGPRHIEQAEKPKSETRH